MKLHIVSSVKCFVEDVIKEEENTVQMIEETFNKMKGE